MATECQGCVAFGYVRDESAVAFRTLGICPVCGDVHVHRIQQLRSAVWSHSVLGLSDGDGLMYCFSSGKVLRAQGTRLRHPKRTYLDTIYAHGNRVEGLWEGPLHLSFDRA